MKRIPHHTPLLYRKKEFAGVYLHVFFLCLLQNIAVGTRKNHLAESVLTCTHKKIIKQFSNFLMKIFIFKNFYNLCILHGVFVMKG